MNMKVFKKTALLFLCLICCMGFRSQALAAHSVKYVSVPLTQNKKTVQKETGFKYYQKTGRALWTYYRYKVTVPSEGYLTFVLGKGKSKISGLSLSMYLKVNDTDILDDWFFSGKKKMTVLIPVSKGTYFFSTAEKGTMRYRFTAVKSGKNYSPGSAAVLKKGTKVKICQTPENNFPRWYKIVLKKNQRISFWTSQGDLAVLVDSRKNPVEVKKTKSAGKYVSSKTLPKGTYYLCMKMMDVGETLYSNRYYYTTLYWK